MDQRAARRATEHGRDREARMLVVHANWSGGWVHLWGEALSSRTTAGEHAHPFAADAETLRSALGLGELCEGKESTIRVKLPTRGERPEPSPRLAHAGAGVDGETSEEVEIALRAWEVPTVRIGVGRALEALERVEDRDHVGENGERLLAGPGVVFFATAARLARSLQADERFVPALLQEGTGALKGTWQPWLADESSVERVSALVRAMPGVARAADDAFEHDAWAICEDFLWRVMDASVREALTRESFIEAVEGRETSDPVVAWLNGLLAEGESVGVKSEGRTTALRSVRQWLGNLEDRGRGGAFRLLFRLEEPEDTSIVGSGGGEAKWGLSFHLRSVERAEAEISAEEIWALGADRASVGGLVVEGPQDLLLAELARASRVYARIEDALSGTEPTGLTLNTRQAYEFLREVSPVLMEQGFAVDSPTWWDTPASRLGAKLVVRSDEMEAVTGGGGGSGRAGETTVGMDTLVSYSWQIAVGDTTLSLREFEMLAKEQAPLIRVEGQWVEIRPEDVRAAVRFLKENPGGNAHVSEVLRLAYAWDAERAGMAMLGIEATGWVSALFSSEAERLPMLEQPQGFRGALRAYQARGMSWLAFLERFGLGACLADDMGLGKTVQVLALLVHEREKNPETRPEPTLIVAPMSVVSNWKREAERFAPSLKVVVHHGSERGQGEAMAREASDADVVLTTYALAHRDRDALTKVEWGRVVLDEAQNVKNPGAKQSRAVHALRAKRRVALTGTPVENRLSELWSIMDFCNPGLLGSSGEFRRRFAAPIERHHDQAKAKQLRSLVQPFVLRRLKSDPTISPDLPAKVETREFCRLTPEQAALYESTVKRMLAEADRAEGIQRRGLVLASLVRLKQICNHPAQFLRDTTGRADPSRSGKCVRILEMLDEALSEGDQALIFTQFREMGKILVPMLSHALDREVLFLHGGTPAKAREEMVDRFQKADGTAPVFVVSLKAGGTGLNLTAANHVFHFDRWWNPAVENQATDRAHRIGQTRTVQVHKFIVAGSLEERIDRMIEQKTDLAERIIGAGEDWLTELSTAQLRELVSLGPDAVSDEDDDAPPASVHVETSIRDLDEEAMLS